MQPESSSRHRGGPMPNRWCVNYTGCRFNTELTTRCLCWHTMTLNTSVPQYVSQRINRRVNARTLRSTATQQCSSNRSLAPTSQNVLYHAVCLELTSCVCHRKRLTVCIQISSSSFKPH